MQWFYVVDGEQVGPVEGIELKSLLQAGTLPADTLVWHAEMGAEWRPASTLVELGGEATQSLVSSSALAVQNIEVVEGSAAAEVQGDGTTENKELMRLARVALDGKWGMGALVAFVYMLVIYGISYVVPYVIYFIAGALVFGFWLFFINIARAREAKVGQLFAGFQMYVSTLVAYLLTYLYVVLWSLLLIVPGIMATYSYTMVYAILIDNPEMSATEAIRLSKKMMYGYRWKLFLLSLRFMGWSILCIFTLGIGYLWLIPYIQTAKALFYEDIRNANGPAQLDAQYQR